MRDATSSFCIVKYNVCSKEAYSTDRFRHDGRDCREEACQESKRNALHNGQNSILIASNIVADASKIAAKYPNCTGCEVDVMNAASLGPLVDKSDIVISYIPAALHVQVAKQCLQSKKNLVTASYVSQGMRELNDEAVKNDLIFLNELGLDPGIDHMSTMKVINEVAAEGGRYNQHDL